MKALIFIFSLVSFSTTHLLGQGYDTGANYDILGTLNRQTIAQQAIKDLKKGVLVVRLKTGNSKIKAMQQVVSSQNVAEYDREKFEKKIVDYQREVRLENERLIQALRDHYSFSETIYMLDTSAIQLKNGVQEGYFLNENMKLDPGISLDGKPYLVLYYGNPISSRKSGVDGLVMLDSNLKELVEPFPFFSGISTIKRALAKFFNKKEESEFYNEMVVKLQKRLEEYYEMVK